ncbi:hypothetical protein B0H14DRAFT_2646063 [Mycena olivaceomarginata]|nr:hypothetical protein B0H14DRAFT_2646063 [Mycena olivaceomarginata]
MAAGQKRSQANVAKKLDRFLAEGGAYERGQKKIEEYTVILNLDLPFPDHFAGWTRDRWLVAQNAAEGGWLQPSELPDITTDDRLKLLIKTNDPTPAQLKLFGPNQYPLWFLGMRFLDPRQREHLYSDRAPQWLAMCFPNVIPPHTQQMLLCWWDRVIACGLQFPKPEKQRSSTPAVHLGVWNLYSMKPYVTADSRQKIAPARRTASAKLLAELKQKRVIKQLDIFLGIIKNHVVPKLESLAEWHFDESTRIRHRIHQRVCATLRHKFRKRPNLDFGGLFFTIAVKEGSSEVLHVDWNDNLHMYTIIFAVGDYTGGEFCIPQIGYRIPLRPGAVLAVRTRLLAHCTHVGSGRRLVFTCFTDSTLLGQSITGDFALL